MSRRPWMAGSLLAALLPAQQQEPFGEADARAVLQLFAAAAPGAAPLPAVDPVAERIAGRFATAGLQQVCGDSWFHTMRLDGYRLDSNAIQVALHSDIGGKVTTRMLQADTEVRLWRGGDAASEEDRPAVVLFSQDPRTADMLAAAGARQATLLEVSEADPRWQQSKGMHTSQVGGRRGARPVFLVRYGVLSRPSDEQEGKVGYRISWQAPRPEVVAMELRNVVGLLPGPDAGAELVLLSAPYGPLDGGGDAAPAAALILAMEQLVRPPGPARGVLFVCFAGDESGLRGARAFAANPPLPLTRLRAAVNLDRVGVPATAAPLQAWLTGSGCSDLAALAGPALAGAGFELVDSRFAGMLFPAADNFPLALRGVVAHSLRTGSLLEDPLAQPTPSGEPENLAAILAAARGLGELASALASGPAPQFTPAGKALLQQYQGGR